VKRIPGFPFSLNSAVDTLLKKEFDVYREKGEVHPLIAQYGVDAIPAKHANLEEWRYNFKGISYLHKPTNLIIFGAIDDLWQNSDGEYIIVDYKSTSKYKDITALDEAWQDTYKRQMEIYQWLLRQNGYAVSNTGYFVYCNGRTDLASFNRKLEFDVTLIPYEGNDKWVENTILDAYECMKNNSIPSANESCDYCAYHDAVRKELTQRLY
jgi:hypothetical protein